MQERSSYTTLCAVVSFFLITSARRGSWGPALDGRPDDKHSMAAAEVYRCTMLRIHEESECGARNDDEPQTDGCLAD